MHLSYWICATITAASAFVSLGFSLAGLRASARADSVGYLYAVARSIALAAIAVIAFFTASLAFVAAAAIAMVVTQAADALIGVRIQNRVKTFGPAATALVNAAALIWMLVAR